MTSHIDRFILYNVEYFLQMLQTISVADLKRLQSDSNPTLHFYSDPEPDPDSKFKKQKHSDLNLSTVTF